MRFLVRNIPMVELATHLIIIVSVLVSYGYLLTAAFVLPLPSRYTYLMQNVFQKFVSPDPIFAGMPNSRWCNTADGMIGFVSIAERGSQCQLNFDAFLQFCNVFGLRMTDAEKRIFFNTLDITGNRMLSWGEVSVDYFNTSMPAFIYYLARWKTWKYVTGAYGTGLERIEGFNYEPFRFDNTTSIFPGQGIWGPLGIAESQPIL